MKTIPQIIIERMSRKPYGYAQMKALYDAASEAGAESGNWSLARAIDGGTNADIVRELCEYLRVSGNTPFAPFLAAYVKMQNWIAA